MQLDLRPTRREWLDVALRDLDATLCDHFHCERKAASSALALVRYYPQDTEMVAELAKLAHEETRHMLQVSARIERRGLVLARDRGDIYAAGLRREVRPGEPARQLDMLIICGLIEARSAERLALLGAELGKNDASLAELYRKLAEAEDRHRDLFLRLAQRLAPPVAFEKRVRALVAIEGELVATLPLEARIH
jgi:tRNA 2-(methylsulfanyl)-N6-isopentenyladenosine37 hydroxylase